MKRIALIVMIAAAMLTLASCGGKSLETVKLKVSADPEGAAIRIFNGDTQLQPEDGEGSDYILQPGVYTYSAECDGYVTVSSWEFTVTEEPEQTLEIELTPLSDAFGVIYANPEIENHDFYGDYQESIENEDNN